MTQRLGIVGAGTMGAGIMINAVTRGVDVVLCDRSEDVLNTANARLDKYLTRQIQKDRISEADAAQIASRLSRTEELSGLADCDLIIEAVFENLEVKKTIFAELETVARKDAIFASNTSCLRLADIAEALSNKDRFCGMHYFSPAEINPVVELIEGPDTSATTFTTATAFLTATSREVIACKDQNGFALNRFFCPYSNEAVRILDEGLATTSQIDQIARVTFGLALGPFAVMNIIGTATTLNAVRNLGALGPYYSEAKGLEAKGENNTPWDIEEVAPALDEATNNAIADRLTGAILLPVLEELSEGTATLDAIDKGASLAFRFEKTPGVLLNELGSENVVTLTADLASKYDHPAPNVGLEHAA